MRVAADEGSGPVAVLLHGQPGDSAEFLLVRQALRGQGLRVLTVDRSGYRGDGGAASGYAGNAADLAGLLDRLEVARARLLGASWAGGVALEFALMYPERTDGLVLSGSIGAPGSVVPVDHLFALPGVVRLAALAFSRLDGLLEWSSGSEFTPAGRAITRSASRRWRRNGGWAAFRVEQQAMVADTGPLWERLHPLDVPITVVHGRRDLYVPVTSGRLLAGRLQTRFVEVDAGHVLHLEVPALLAAELLAVAPLPPPAGDARP